LELTLVAVVGGARLPVTLVDVQCWIVDHFDIPGDNFHVKRCYPEDFIIVFSYLDDMLRVLHEAPTGHVAFNLVFKRWRR
jgi:hypothetical protein